MSALGALRADLSEILSGITLDESVDVPVLAHIVDAIEPPCFMLSWGAPMLEPMTACAYRCRPAVICIGGRLNAEEGQATCEALVEAALTRLRRGYALEMVEQLAQMEMAGITYLSTRLILQTTLTIGAPNNEYTNA